MYERSTFRRHFKASWSIQSQRKYILLCKPKYLHGFCFCGNRGFRMALFEVKRWQLELCMHQAYKIFFKHNRWFSSVSFFSGYIFDYCLKIKIYAFSSCFCFENVFWKPVTLWNFLQLCSILVHCQLLDILWYKKEKKSRVLWISQVHQMICLLSFSNILLFSFFFLCITFKVAFVCDQIISAVAENTSLIQWGSMFKNLFSSESGTRIINNSIKWKWILV